MSGRVTSASGSASNGVTVLIAGKPASTRTAEGALPGAVPVPGGTERPYGASYTKRTVTDSSGRYEANGLPPGSLAVVAIRRGARIPVQRFQTREGDSVTANFVLPD